ncbi:MAG TPA: hypothetical protein PLD20_26800 [Blastocatellia bacterium]|nr:hypothetical protein [Blastocatellia bacterium]HMV83912.1 hypothetical protein [Blastocatellia bacterium]HMX28484.1 hypothetical protein [Blastocatellia bacterium]HMY74921.1 hypothetical protein [Blastocatellia bacterium]HMZ21572.1 hypothetical protein [Blastocatellia bacterium]
MNYGNFLMRVRKHLQQHRGLIGAVRAVRALWVLGPWQNVFIHYHRKFSRNPLLPRNEKSLFESLNVASFVAGLKINGFARGLQVPQPLVGEIKQFCERQPANAHNNPHLHCEAIKQIAHDPKVIEVAERYLGAEPILYQTSLYWSSPTADGKLERQPRFHYDIGDYRAVYLFIYLTDVDEQSGPHLIIEGTHRRKTFRQLLSRHLSDEEVQNQFDGRIRTICGNSGEGFFEDLTCYHKRSTTTKPRLMLTIAYMLQRTPLLKSPATNTISNAEENLARLVQTS